MSHVFDNLNRKCRRRDLRTSMPIQSAAITSSSQVNRRVFCQYYGDCLDHAIEKRWAGFSCEECKSFEDERMEPGQEGNDFSRCAVLAYMCFSQ